MIGILCAARVRRVLLLVGLAFAVLPVGSAIATTIGQTGTGGACGGRTGSGEADGNYVVPAGGGLITSFSFQTTTANGGEKLDFLVLRRAGPGDYTVVGETGLVTLTGMGTEPETFPVIPAIAVQGGDILGWWMPAHGALENCQSDVPSGGGVLAFGASSDPSVGESVGVGPRNPFHDLNESANLAASTSTALTAVAPNPALATEPVTLTATVTPKPDGGTVAFADGTNPIGGCGAVPVNTTTGMATCTTTSLPVGRDSLTATYGGDGSLANFAASPASAPVVEVIEADTLANLSALLLQEVEGSAAFRAQPPVNRQFTLSLAEYEIGQLGPVTPQSLPGVKAELKGLVAEFEAQRFLTPAQAATLDNLANNLQP